MSKNQMRRLGERLRKTAQPEPNDLVSLRQLIAAHDGPLQQVQNQLESLGLQAPGRLKSHQTLMDKLRNGMELDRIRDIAGARIVEDCTLTEQIQLARRLQSQWPDSKFVDRLADPVHGYRALHLEVKENNFSVEIQVRTIWQHEWAETCEKVADHWGRQIRYGGPPNNPETLFEGHTRLHLVELLRDVSGLVSDSERLADNMVKIRAAQEVMHEMRIAAEALDANPSADPEERDRVTREATAHYEGSKSLSGECQLLINRLIAYEEHFHVLGRLKKLPGSTDIRTDDAE